MPLITDLFNLICIPNKVQKKKSNKSYRSTFSKHRASKWGVTVASAHGNKDSQAIKKTKEELKRKGNFYLAFPNMNYPYYKKFFEDPRPLNDLVFTTLFEKEKS